TLDEIDEERIQEELSVHHYSTVDELLEDIGLGNRLAPLVARDLSAAESLPSFEVSTPPAIRGTEAMLVTYANCCYPSPGDGIMAQLSSGRGIVVHRRSRK